MDYTPATGGPVPIPRYVFDGTAQMGGRTVPMRMEPVMVDHRWSASFHRDLKNDFTFKAISGDSLGSEVTSVRAVVPNLLAPAVETETSDRKVRLDPIYPDTDHAIIDPENASKALPTCLLRLERKKSVAGPDLAEAVEVFGWLLSFYAGGAVHPNAWEGETDAGPVWCMWASDVRRLPADLKRTCLPHDVLETFLARAWEA